MRRIVLLVVLVVLLVPRWPASAHFCARPVIVDPGKSSTITIGVAAEEEAAVEVAVHVPKGFDLEGVPASEGWVGTQESPTLVRFTGGSIAPFDCGYLSVRGVAPRKGTLAFPLDVTDDKGQKKAYKSTVLGDQYAAQVVWVGGEPIEHAGLSHTQLELLIVFFVALFGAAVWAVLYAVGATARSAPRPDPQPAARGPARRGSGSSRSGTRKRRPPPRS